MMFIDMERRQQTNTQRLDDQYNDLACRLDQIPAELEAIKSLAVQAREILCDERHPISDFGALLHQAWIEKKKLSSRISTGPIEQIYNTTRDAGATGGKLLGAGGGGFLLIFAEPKNHATLRSALAAYEIIDFHPDNSGSSVVYYHGG
jgi:D-glycero-alpha-D-manno-heptose-7-phosphate kinase